MTVSGYTISHRIDVGEVAAQEGRNMQKRCKQTRNRFGEKCCIALRMMSNQCREKAAPILCNLRMNVSNYYEGLGWHLYKI